MFGKNSKGVYFALIAALISGFSIFLNKFAVTAVGQPLVFTAVKNTCVAVFIIAFIVFSGKWMQIKFLSKRKLVLLFIVGVIGGSIPFYLFFTGLSSIPAINGAIIQKTLVLWVAILALPLLKEKLTKVGAAMVFVLFFANVLVGGFSGFKFSTGEGLVLLATLFWAVETVIAKKILPNMDSDLLVAARMGFGSLILLILSAVLQPTSLAKVFTFSVGQWEWVILTSILLLFYVATWYRALKFAPAIVVTSVLVGATIVTNILSAIFVIHSVNLPLVVQSVLILLAVGFLIRVESKSAFEGPQGFVSPKI